MSAHRKRRVLIVNAYFDPWLSSTPTQLFLPRATAPFYLAGYFDRATVDIRVHDEVHNGALLDKRLFEWPDLVILAGLTAAFDRARQLAAYFRHFNPEAPIAIGGPIPRAMPLLCNQIFDYVCQGDVDAIGPVIDAVLGPDHRADIGNTAPRFDLIDRPWGLGFVETSKYCNFACSFCSLTGEKRGYRPYTSAAIEQQLQASGKTFLMMVLDNNLYGNNRADFRRRVEILGDYWRRGQYRGWGALVTGDFFSRQENLDFVAANGCKALFSGVESLDPIVLKDFNKRHSLSSDPHTLAQACAERGIMFDYGMMLDFTRQTVSEIEGQVAKLFAATKTPLPALLSLTIPILGTPYFDDAARSGRLMPNLRLSDLDGQKIVEWPKEPLDQVVPYVGDLLTFRNRKAALIRHSIAHAWSRRRDYDIGQMLLAAVRPGVRFGGATIKIGSLRQMRQGFREPKMTFCAMTDGERSAYRPAFPLPAGFEQDFEPFRVTDSKGRLTDHVMAEAAERQRLLMPMSA